MELISKIKYIKLVYKSSNSSKTCEYYTKSPNNYHYNENGLYTILHSNGLYTTWVKIYTFIESEDYIKMKHYVDKYLVIALRNNKILKIVENISNHE